MVRERDLVLDEHDQKPRTIRLTAEVDGVQKHEDILIKYSSGYIYVQTSQPIYKPGDLGEWIMYICRTYFGGQSLIGPPIVAVVTRSQLSVVEIDSLYIKHCQDYPSFKNTHFNYMMIGVHKNRTIAVHSQTRCLDLCASKVKILLYTYHRSTRTTRGTAWYPKNGVFSNISRDTLYSCHIYIFFFTRLETLTICSCNYFTFKTFSINPQSTLVYGLLYTIVAHRRGLIED